MSWLNIASALAIMSTASVETAVQTEATIAPQPAAQEAGTQILQIQPDSYRRMTVPVTIQGQGPFSFMIDTGSEATVLSHELADLLQLNDRGMATLVAMASTREVETTPVEDFNLGNQSMRIPQAPLVEGENIGGADGILGLDSLQDQRVLIDFERRQIEVADAASLGGNRGYDIIVRARRSEGQLIMARAELNGIRVAVVVDTGAQGSLGNAALRERLRRARDAGEAQITDVNGVQISSDLRNVRKLEIGRLELTNFPISFADSPTFAALGLDDRPALLLGMSELRAFDRVAIDFPSRRVLFDVPDSVRLRAVQEFGRYSR